MPSRMQFSVTLWPSSECPHCGAVSHPHPTRKEIPWPDGGLVIIDGMPLYQCEQGHEFLELTSGADTMEALKPLVARRKRPGEDLALRLQWLNFPAFATPESAFDGARELNLAVGF